MMSSTASEALISDLRAKLSLYDIRKLGEYPQPPEGFQRAAVLLPLVVRDGQLHILLTQRAVHMRTHPSTVSFPGGKADPTDASDIQTALREAEEEIGLPADQVEILGVLTRGMILPSMVVYPVVGLIPSSFVPDPNPAEVDFAFFMPLADFVSKDKVAVRSFNIRGRTYQSRRFLYHHHNEQEVIVWGFTSAFCMLVAQITLSIEKPFELLKGSKKHTHLYSGFEEYFEHVVRTKNTTSKL